MPDYALESDVKKEIMRVVGARPDVRVWNNPTGVAYTRAALEAVYQQGRRGTRMEVPPSGTITYGSVGSPDLLGMIKGGYSLGIEVKSEVGRQREAQKVWQTVTERFGCLYILARSPEEANAAIDAYLESR